jgi:ATP-dependent exoDNAse (exonuclease V) beta subunit
MNYSAWRDSLLRKGICETEADADAYMEQHRVHRAQVGTDFHHLSESELLSTKCRVVEEESIEMLGRWREQFLPRIGKVLLIEQPMLHRAFMYCGTPDLLAEIDGELTLCDWKSQQAGKEKVRTEWALQIGAYAKLIEHTYGLLLRKAAMVIVTTDGVRIQSYNHADIQQGWQRFAGFLAEYHALQAKLGSLPHQIALTAMEKLFL